LANSDIGDADGKVTAALCPANLEAAITASRATVEIDLRTLEQYHEAIDNTLIAVQYFYNENLMALDVLQFGDFLLYVSQRQLTQANEIVPLQPKHLDVLLLLVQQAGKLISRQEIMETVWPGVYVDPATLTNAVSLLRKTIGPDAITTVSKHGYRFGIPVSPLRTPSALAAQWMEQGKRLMNTRLTANVTQARHFFWLAIAEDPELAEAWTWLARACRFLEKGQIDPQNNRSLCEAAFRRSFVLDPNLGATHQFYTTFQADTGASLDALRRLLKRLRYFPNDAPTYAGLVQVCRFGGLLDASLAAHNRAIALDPKVVTSVPHTYFARCEYQSVIESYAVIASGFHGYCDAAAWACLLPQGGIASTIAGRLRDLSFPPIFDALLRTLLFALQGEAEFVLQIAQSQDLVNDPEAAILFARNLSYVGYAQEAFPLLRGATRSGFAAAVMLERDPWLVNVKSHPDFPSLQAECAEIVQSAENIFHAEAGPHLLGLD